MENIPLLQQAKEKLKNNQASDALTLCNTFIEEVAKQSHEKLHGELLLSDILLELGKTGESLAAIERAVSQFSTDTLPADKLQVLSILSYRNNDLGFYQKAAENWVKVGEYSAEVGSVDFFIQALLGIASMLEIVGEALVALTFLNQAQFLAKKSTSSVTHARLHLHIVSCYIALKKYDKAQKYLNLCHDNDVLEVIFEAFIPLYQAKIYRKTGKLKEALKEINRGKEIAKRGGETWTRSMISLELGRCLIEDGDAYKATTLLSGTCEHIKGLGLDLVEQKLNGALSDAYAQLTQFDTALEYEKISHQVELSLIDKIPVGQLECEFFDKLSQQQRLLLIKHTRLENKDLKVQVEDQHGIVEQLQHDVYTDPLTNVYNRRWLDEELQKKQDDYAILMIDADHFKTVNDDFSHQTGDYVLKRLASILSSVVRPVDGVVRFGGEEFVIIVCEANERQVSGLAERIRHTVEVSNWSDLLPGRPLTISLGGGVKLGDESADELLTRADAGLYKAKSNGRNCYVFNKE